MHSGALAASVRKLLEMIRFSHTLFALPFALLSAALAWRSKGEFSWLELNAIILCMVFARSAAMAFNRLADKDIDALNPRTLSRHLPSGLLTPTIVWLFAFACAIDFVFATAIFLAAEPANPWPLILSGPVLLFICGYSYAKRFTYLSHFWLGASLLLAPFGAWIAIRGLESLTIPLVLGLAVCFWVAGFDIIYACQDAEFDRQARLSSIPARVGVATALRLAFLCHLVMLGFLVALYFVAEPMLGTIYLAGVAAVGLLLLYEHWLVKPTDLTRVNQAFFQVNAIISVGLLAVVLIDMAVHG
jgi:4-hydroxybenzoate polyprenyltransferase